MSRIHPSLSENKVHDGDDVGRAGQCPSAAASAVYTVWKKSSMGFQGTDGFSVYDGAGSLAFRVDNYSRRRKLFAGELLLMDGRGSPLVALRPQILSTHDQWNCYRASDDVFDKKSKSQHLFSMRKRSILQSSDEAEVYMTASTTAWDHSGSPHEPSFRIDGCFRSSCKISRSNGEEVARMSRKKVVATSNSVTLGDDVFSLIVRPSVDVTIMMAFVIVMDRISWRAYTPLMCS